MTVNPIIWLILTVIDIYIWFVIASVIVSWLVAFDVVNLRNRFVYIVYDVLYRVTEPAMGQIRRYVPRLGQLDLSPLVLLLLLYFIKYSVLWAYFELFR